MSWKRAAYSAAIVALISCTAGGDSAGDLAIETGSLVSQALPMAGQVSGGLLLAPGERPYWPVSGKRACSPYELAAYSHHTSGCDGALSMLPASQDSVVYFGRGAAAGAEPAPDSETVLEDGDLHGVVVAVTLEIVETRTLYASNSGSADAVLRQRTEMVVWRNFNAR